MLRHAAASNLFQGKTVIVTGSNTGLGYEAALHVARLGVEKLIVAVRTFSKGDEILDMSRSSRVIAFARRAQSLKRLDALIANAGISPTEFELSPDDDEMSAQVNVISTFLLSCVLLPQLQHTSRKHDIARRPSGAGLYESLSDPAKFGGASQYSLTKLMELLICRELAVKVVSPIASVVSPIASVVNPGLCESEIGNMKAIIYLIRTALSLVIVRTAEVGSRSLVAVVCCGKDSHGQFMSDFVNQEVAAWLETREDEEIQKEVWEQTLTRLKKIEPGLREKTGL